jgi:nitrite reductase (NADH) large subunit
MAASGDLWRGLMNEMNRTVIVGAGIAGVSAAETLRKADVNAEIILLSAEGNLPYYRLSLTKYLSGELKREGVFLHPEKWYADKNIDLRLNAKVVKVDKSNKSVELEDGTFIEWNRLILATGGIPFIPPIPGSQLKGIMSIRTLEDADYLLNLLKGRKNCICIGGGVLGLEVAEAIARTGVQVKLFEVAPWLMPRQLNTQAASMLQSHVEGIGIDVTVGAKIKGFVGEETCEGILLEGGEVIPGDLVIVTTGIKADTRLAAGAGLAVNRGIIANDYMNTSDGSIWTSGDCTEHNGVLYGLWFASQSQGKIAGANAAGVVTPFEDIPLSVVLKVLGIDLFSIGDFDPKNDSCKAYEQIEEGKYHLFVVQGDRLIGSIILGDRPMSNRVKPAVDKHQVFPETEYVSAEDFIRHFRNP